MNRNQETGSRHSGYTAGALNPSTELQLEKRDLCRHIATRMDFTADCIFLPKNQEEESDHPKKVPSTSRTFLGDVLFGRFLVLFFACMINVSCCVLFACLYTKPGPRVAGCLRFEGCGICALLSMQFVFLIFVACVYKV